MFDMRDTGDGRPYAGNAIFRGTAAVFLILLPALTGSALSIMQFFIPAAVAAILAGDQRSNTIIACASFAGVFLAMVSGHPDGMPVVVQNSGVAMLISQAEQRGYPGPFTFLSAAIFLIVAVLAGMALLSGVGISSALNAITEEISRSLDKSFTDYIAGSGMSAPPDDVVIWFEQIKQAVMEFFPGMIGCSLAAVAMSNVFLARMWIRRRDGRDVLGPEFRKWQFPDWLIWVFIIAGAGVVSGAESYSYAGKNMMLLVGFCYLVQGISILQYYFYVLEPPVYVRWITWLVLGLQWYGLAALALLGMACTWFDIRGTIDGKYGDRTKKNDNA